jgi:hypothetical protein
MKKLVLSLLLTACSAALAENVTIKGLYGCETANHQRLKLRFLAMVANCTPAECPPGTKEISYRNYQYIQQNHCRKIESGEYKVLRQSPVPGGRVVQVKSNGELLWVLD